MSQQPLDCQVIMHAQLDLWKFSIILTQVRAHTHTLKRIGTWVKFKSGLFSKSLFWRFKSGLSHGGSALEREIASAMGTFGREVQVCALQLFPHWGSNWAIGTHAPSHSWLGWKYPRSPRIPLTSQVREWGVLGLLQRQLEWNSFICLCKSPCIPLASESESKNVLFGGGGLEQNCPKRLPYLYSYDALWHHITQCSWGT